MADSHWFDAIKRVVTNEIKQRLKNWPDETQKHTQQTGKPTQTHLHTFTQFIHK